MEKVKVVIVGASHMGQISIDFRIVNNVMGQM